MQQWSSKPPRPRIRSPKKVKNWRSSLGFSTPATRPNPPIRENYQCKKLMAWSSADNSAKMKEKYCNMRKTCAGIQAPIRLPASQLQTDYALGTWSVPSANQTALDLAGIVIQAAGGLPVYARNPVLANLSRRRLNCWSP